MFNLTMTGHLGADATVGTHEGKQVINFSVASTKKWKDKAGKDQSITNWVSCSWWTDRTAILPYLKKGTMVLISGTPSVKTYQNNKQQTDYSLNCSIDNLELLSSKKDEEPVPF